MYVCPHAYICICMHTYKHAHMLISMDAHRGAFIQTPACLHIYIGVCVCDRSHRYARWIGRLSHQSSNLSHLCNPLQKVVILALPDTGFEWMQVMNYPTNCQTTKVVLTKGFPKRSGHMQVDKQDAQFIQDIILLHERYRYSWSRGSVTS